MIRKVQRTWFEVWGDAESQNHILKLLLAYFVVLSSVLAVVLTCLALRKPVLVALSASESRIVESATPSDELLLAEARRAIRQYVTMHHNWNWKDIEKALAGASRYVHEDYRKTFARDNERIKKLATEKRLSQRFYFDEVTVDLANKTAKAVGERILVVEGLRAANPFAVEVTFETGPRHKENPEGIYIASEKRIEDQALIQPGGR